MKVLVCAESVGALSPSEVAEALARGWRRVSADALVERPMSDGGPGFLAAVAAGQSTTRRELEVSGPVGDPVRAAYLVTDDGTAWIEAAQATGAHLLPAAHRDLGGTTSHGVGQLMAAALAGGAGRMVLGVGGVHACDAGAGMLEALGARATPGGHLGRGGVPLAGLQDVDLGAALAGFAGCRLEFATDLDVPLTGPRGVARGFAAGQEAASETVDLLEASMTTWGGLLGKAPTGRRVSVLLGSGAGGGLGAALFRLGARRIPGIATVLSAAGIGEQCQDADLVLAAVGSLDAAGLRGSVLAAVAEQALDRALPVVVLAGQLHVSRRQWITAGVTAAFAVIGDPQAPDSAAPDLVALESATPESANPLAPGPAAPDAAALAGAAERVARTWSQ